MQESLPNAERVEFRKAGSAGLATFLLFLVSAIAVVAAATGDTRDTPLNSVLLILTIALAFLTISLLLFVGRLLLIRGPLVIIDEVGIVDRRLGRHPIRWNEIKRVEWRTFAGHPTIGLWVNDGSDIYGRFNIVGRLELFIRRLIFPNFPPIEIEEIGLDQDDRRLLTIAIVRFSRHPLQAPVGAGPMHDTLSRARQSSTLNIDSRDSPSRYYD